MNKKVLLLSLLVIIGGFLVGFLGLRSVDQSCLALRHYSYFSTPEFFDQAYKNASSTAVDSSVRGIIVNHHLLAANLIAATMAKIATIKPVTVILVSPNHFMAANGKIIASSADWETPYGILSGDCGAVKQLQSRGVLNVDERPFDKEHGISGIVPFIKKSLPNATVIPIIIKDTASDKDIDNLATALRVLSDSNTLIIGSFDFSHYVPDAIAMRQDQDSIKALKNFDFAALKNVAVDSRPGLRLLLKYLAGEGANNFTLTAHTDSAQILGDPSLVETTSYIDGIFKP